MDVKRTFAAAAAALTVAGVGCSAAWSATQTAAGIPSGPRHVNRDASFGPFIARVSSGRLAGFDLQGVLEIHRPTAGSRRLTGVLADPGSSAERGRGIIATVTGTLTGKRVKLTFKTKDGLVLTGTGATRGLGKGKIAGALQVRGGGRGDWSATNDKEVVIFAPSFYSTYCTNPNQLILIDGGNGYNCHLMSFIA